MPERARRRSLFFGLTMSTSDWVPVMLCTVVIIPFSMVNCATHTEQAQHTHVMPAGQKNARDNHAVRRRLLRAWRRGTFSWMTLITGAMQLVVHDAAVQMTCEASSLSSFTPTTTLSTLFSFTGADTTTRLTPQTSMYGISFSTVRKTPSHAMTRSTPLPFQSTLVKSFSSEKLTVLPSTVNAAAPAASTSLSQVPCTLSYLTR